MKGILVFNQLNDVSYIKSDEEFKKHVHSEAVKEGFLQPDSDPNAEIDPNVAVMLFSTLVNSQRFMISEADNAYQSIRCENNFLFVFKQVNKSDYIWLAINGDGTETEEFLTRKLSVLHRIVAFLYGPVLEELRPTKQSERLERWTFISRILDVWQHLYNTEQSFLVEAIERLHVNQQLNSRCIQLLELAMNAFKAAGEKHVVHAMFIVHSKLLALFSSRNATELNNSDLLTLILFANALFPPSLPSAEVLSYTASSRPVPPPPTVTSKTPFSELNLHTYEAPVNSDEENSEFEVYSNHSKDTSEEEEKSEEDSESVEDIQETTLLDELNPDVNKPYIDSCKKKKESEIESNEQQLCDENQSHDCGDFDNDSQLENVKTQNFGEKVDKIAEDISNLNVCVHVNKNTGDDAERETSDSIEKKSDVIDSLSLADEPSPVLENTQTLNLDKTNQLQRPQSVVSRSGVETGDDNETSLDAEETESTGDNTDVTGSTTTLVGDSNGDSNTAIPSTANPDSMNPHPSTSEESSADPKTASQNTPGLSSSGPSPVGQPAPPPASRPPASPAVDADYVFVEQGAKESDDQPLAAGSGRDHQTYTIMLNALKGQYLPHALHAIRVMPGITLLVVSELTVSAHCTVLTNSLTTLRVLLAGRFRPASLASSRQLLDFLDTNVKRLSEILKKCRGSNQLERHRADIVAKWTQAKQSGFLAYLDRPPASGQMDMRLESLVSGVHDHMVSVFRILFLQLDRQPPDREQILTDAVQQILKSLQKQLLDFKQYLSIKAQRNITMTSYLEDFPGLIHFIYVNRATHQVTAPSMAGSRGTAGDQLDPGGMDIATYLRDKITQKVKWIQRKVSEGYTSITCRDGDLHFSYFLWFEDPMGNPLPVQKQFRGFERYTPPGILCTNFYHYIQSECFAGAALAPRSVACYELYTVHLGIMPTSLVLTHCRKLASRMWETEGEATSPISLL